MLIKDKITKQYVDVIARINNKNKHLIILYLDLIETNRCDYSENFKKLKQPASVADSQVNYGIFENDSLYCLDLSSNITHYKTSKMNWRDYLDSIAKYVEENNNRLKSINEIWKGVDDKEIVVENFISAEDFIMRFEQFRYLTEIEIEDLLKRYFSQNILRTIKRAMNNFNPSEDEEFYKGKKEDNHKPIEEDSYKLLKISPTERIRNKLKQISVN